MSENQTPAAMPSDAELFHQSMEPAAPAPKESEAPPAAEPTPQPTDDTHPRGADGRFIARDDQPASDAPAAATSQPPAPAPGQPPQQDDGQPVPSWRHRELREQRDAEATRARQMEQMIYELQRQNAALQGQIKPPEAPQVPDMFQDPQAYHQFITTQHQNAMRNMEANFSFRLAHREHGEMFEQAYVTMIQRAERGDPSVVRQVMASPDPGAAMVNWFRREQTLSTVGDDPNAWFEAQLAERLKDQKFAGSIVEKIRGAAPATSPNGAPNVQLPPSLNRVAASAPNVAVNGMPSDADMFHHAFREGR
jgi:hypothetical protein